MDLNINADKVFEESINLAFKKFHTDPLVAEIIVDQVLRTFPGNVKALHLMGLIKHKIERYDKAIEFYEEALEQEPENVEILNDLALSYSGVDEVEKSRQLLLKVVELEPRPEFYNNLAVQWRISGHLEQAIELTKKAIELSPNKAELWCNLGGIYGELKDMEKCIECCRKAIEIDPNWDAAHIDLAFSLMTIGQLQEGFKEYEWRFKCFRQLEHYRNAYDHSKRWKGIKEQSIQGKRVIIVCEQGRGDVIQFIRYIKEVKNLGAYVIVQAYEDIKGIIERTEGVDETFLRDTINDTGEEIPEHDYHFPILSIMPLTNCWKISGEPYLKPLGIFDVAKGDYKDTFNIGISWAGNPGHPNDRFRSIMLKEFKSIQTLENIKLFSLQVDVRPHKHRFFKDPVDYTENCQDMSLVNLVPFIQHFDDTLVLMNGLHLIIAADTAIVHLAGAAGIPCWMLVPFGADWRWGLEGNKTNWYNSLELFRQENSKNWPISRIVEKLQDKNVIKQLIEAHQERNNASFLSNK